MSSTNGVSENLNDHVHLAALLIREDGRTVDVWRDFVRAGEACNAIDGGAGRAPSSGSCPLTPAAGGVRVVLSAATDSAAGCTARSGPRRGCSCSCCCSAGTSRPRSCGDLHAGESVSAVFVSRITQVVAELIQ